jgi:hypothetical protein
MIKLLDLPSKLLHLIHRRLVFSVLVFDLLSRHLQICVLLLKIVDQSLENRSLHKNDVIQLAANSLLDPVICAKLSSIFN